MKIQVASDLHLEINNAIMPVLIRNENDTDVLVLAGDICTTSYLTLFKKFLMRCNDFKYILHVPGNHEYYSTKYTMSEVNELFKSLEKEIPNYHYLVNETIQIEDVTFIGSTLWSKIPDEHAEFIFNYIGDYRCIWYTKDKLLTVKDTQNLHQECIDFIQSVDKKGKCVLIVHHKPVWDETKYKPESNYAFQNHCEELFKDIPLCIFGHTHESYHKIINDCFVVSNPKGYGNENPEYSNKLVFDIKNEKNI